MRNNQIETFKIMKSKIMIDIFKKMFSLEIEIYCQNWFQKLSLQTKLIFLLIE